MTKTPQQIKNEVEKENVELRRIKEVFNKDIRNVRCPICNHPQNSREAVKITKYYTIFVCECWSGNLDIDSPRHIFKIKVFDIPEVILK